MLKAPLARPYTTEVVRELATDGSYVYVARHPELPGCMAHGDTPEEAVTNLAEARELYVTELERRGVTIPAPSNRVSSIEWTDTTVARSSTVANPVPGQHPTGSSPTPSKWDLLARMGRSR